MTEQLIKKRHALLAALFSLISPGMGHLYVGKWKQAILMPFALLAISGVLGWTGLIFLSQGMYVLMFLIAVFYLVVIVSAVMHARKTSSHRLNRSQRWYFYIVFLVAVSIFGSSLPNYRGKLFAYETFRIPAGSMLPGLLVGDIIVVDTYAYANNQADVGDLVVFDYPKDRNIKYIQRVVARGGDHLIYRDKNLYINGKPVTREFVGLYEVPGTNEQAEIYTELMAGKQYNVAYMPDRPAINAEYIVPEGHYFVMGDNRDNSNDSRYWGVFPVTYLKGKAIYIWISVEDMSIRRERIGLRL
jgi:signal peptidase I